MTLIIELFHVNFSGACSNFFPVPVVIELFHVNFSRFQPLDDRRDWIIPSELFTQQTICILQLFPWIKSMQDKMEIA
jgi:hypothetical protein